jgi:cytochrome c
MFTHERIIAGSVLVAAVLAGCASPVQQPAERAENAFGIGHLASAEEIAGWDIDVTPDGRGLPPGAGTVPEGKAIFVEKCAACHGMDGSGGTSVRLVGGIGTLASKTPVRTIGSFWPYATTLYDYIHRAMPLDKPMSLTPHEVYALSAYLLNANGVVGADAVMNAATLPSVRMPNREGFIAADSKPDFIGDRCMSNCK